MDNLMLIKLKEIMDKTDNVGIAVGKNPGIDEMGAALALYLTLMQNGKTATVASPTDPIVEISSLVGIDKVKKGFDVDQGDLTVSFPYKEGEIEKISYTLESGKLNILVKASEQGLSFDHNNIEYTRGGGAPKLVFVVGTPRLSDLGRIFSPEALKDSTVVNVDYKADNQGFGDILLVNKNASSVSEMIAGIITSLGFNIDVDVASNLLSGIISATKNFQNPNTSALSFEMAGILMKKGAVRQLVSEPKRELNSTQDEDAYSFFTTPQQSKKDVKKTVSMPAAAEENNPPDDWLAPKIYKGSTSV